MINMIEKKKSPFYATIFFLIQTFLPIFAFCYFTV